MYYKSHNGFYKKVISQGVYVDDKVLLAGQSRFATKDKHLIIVIQFHRNQMSITQCIDQSYDWINIEITEEEFDEKYAEAMKIITQYNKK